MSIYDFFTVTSVLLGVWVIYSQKNNKPRPLYAFSKASLTSVDDSRVRVLFDNQPVDNLNVFRWVLWNSGKKAIKAEHISNEHHSAKPQIVFSQDVELLSSEYFYSFDAELKRSVVDTNSIMVDFEFLNQGDAVMGELIFTSKHPNESKFTFQAKLIDLEINEGTTDLYTKFDKVFFNIVFVILVALSISSLFRIFDDYMMSNLFTYDSNFRLLYTPFLIYLSHFYFKNIISSFTTNITKKYREFLSNGVKNKNSFNSHI